MERFWNKKQKNKPGVDQSSPFYPLHPLPWIFAARRRTTKSQVKGFRRLLKGFFEKSSLSFSQKGRQIFWATNSAKIFQMRPQKAYG
jgi:hypothetical protein